MGRKNKLYLYNKYDKILTVKEVPGVVHKL